MARAALQLGVRDLAALSGVSAMTITRFENGHSSGQGTTLRKLQEALEAAGISFTNGDEPGVRIKTPL
jgi:transcriptional regulator with XRE-family HTH domain